MSDAVADIARREEHFMASDVVRDIGSTAPQILTKGHIRRILSLEHEARLDVADDAIQRGPDLRRERTTGRGDR